MRDIQAEQAVIERLCRWAGSHDSIRAMLLYSSRTNPDAPVDVFSDYDVLLAVTDVRAFHEDDRWLEEFGPVLVVFRNPIEPEHGFECFGFITHYEDGAKIDYSFFPVEFLRWSARQPRLPDDLDNGYQVLVDKDGLTAGLPAPTHSAYLPIPPTQRQYRELIDQFFNDALYTGKNLWRDNLLSLKETLDYYMKLQCLRQMLEWHMEVGANWSIKPGAHGKGLKKRTRPGLWVELESTYVGAGKQENWDALFRTVELFRRVAVEVADALGFAYPQSLHAKVTDRLLEIRRMDEQDHPA